MALTRVKNPGNFTVDGSVGIGTSSFNSKLEVKGNSANGSVRVIPNSDNAEASIGYYQDTAGTNMTDRWVAGVGGWGNTNQFTIGNSGSPKLKIDTSGRVTTPYQPRVFANGNISNWTTSTTNQVYTAWQTTGANGSYAVGISYDAATGRFTVPVAGTYYIHSTKYIRLGPSYPSVASRLNIRKNGGVYTRKHTHSYENIPDISISIEALIPMSANDYFDVIEDYTVSHYRGNGHTWLHAHLIG